MAKCTVRWPSNGRGVSAVVRRGGAVVYVMHYGYVVPSRRRGRISRSLKRTHCGGGAN